MPKKPHTAELSAAGTAVPAKTPGDIPAHKRQYITRHGGSVVLDASSVDVHADAVATLTTDIITEESPNAEKP